MKNEKLDELFEKFENQWDVQEIDAKHSERFSKKLIFKKRKKKNKLPPA